MFEFVFYSYIFLAIVIIGGFAFALFLSFARKRAQVYRALNFVLYEISLPQESLKENDKSFKELTGIMEQFFSGMTAIKSYYALEVGLSAKGKEIVFYVAVEKQEGQLFQKLAQGLFPQASISLEKQDYNIFKPQGISLGSFAKFKKHEVLPIRTYDKFDSDPLQVVINTFSKLKEDGEGAALQIIVSPSDDRVATRAKMTASEIRKGKSFNEVLQQWESIGKGVFRETGKLFFGSSQFKTKKVESELSKGQKPVDEELVKFLEAKASHHIVNANVRLISSSENQEKAESVLFELESAFAQFSEPQGNSFDFVKLKRRALKEFFYKFSFRLPDKESMIQINTAELATIFHFPLGITASSAPQLRYVKTKEVAPPLNLSKSGLLLGQNTYRGQVSDVYIKEDDRRRHVYTIGQTGTGKSVFLKNMIIQDIEKGRGVCMIDPHGSDLEEILSRIPAERAEDVIYFNPGDTERPLGLNMLEYDPKYPEQKTFIVNELFGIFDKLFDMKTAGGPMFEQYFRNSVMLVMDDPSSGNTLLEVERVLSNKEFRDYKLSRCSNPLVNSFWKEVAEKAGGEASLQNMVPYITSKFDAFLSNEIMRPIISQKKSAFDFRKVMDEGKILLVNLSKGRLGEINSNLIGLIVVGKILMASLSRADISEEMRKDFYLYIDEFQNITTNSISVILSEARKYKLNLAIAHQFIGQLSEDTKKAIFGNVGSIVSFRVGAEDAEFLQKQFEPAFGVNDLINTNKYNASLKLLIDGQTSRPFSIQTLPFQKGDPASAEKISKLSSQKYGRPKAEIDEELRKKYEVK